MEQIWDILLKKAKMWKAAENGRKKISEMSEKYVHTK